MKLFRGFFMPEHKNKIVFRSALILSVLLGVLSLLAPRQTGAQNWGTPVWSDEFTGPLGTPIDATKWNYDTGILNVNNEVEFYCAPGATGNNCNSTQPNAYIDGNDHLIIQAIKLNPSTTPYSGSWTSARLVTNGTKQFQYGRAEARMMLPVGPGIWPAFWALGTNISTVSWPACGEIDYMENVPAASGLGINKISSTLHGTGYSGSNGLSQKYTFPTGGVTGYHNYGAIWSPNMIQFYVDDPSNVFFVRTASDVPAAESWAFNHPFFLLMNLAIGGDGSWPGPTDATTPNPAIMTVDYVRIYQAAAVPSPSFGNPPSITIKAGASSGNSSSFSIGNSSGTGRVYLTCSTNAPKSTCAISTTDSLNPLTVDFSSSSTATAKVVVATTANALLPPNAFRLSPIDAARIAIFALMALLFALMAIKLGRKMLRPAPAVGIGLLVVAFILLGCGGGNSTAPPPPGNGTTPGSYTITVEAYTVSGDGTNPDATVTIPLTVN
jgi:beta-glucanase (GH16 family)